MLGVDGCPGGWVGAEVDGRRVQWHRAARAADLLELDAEAVGIDIPVGLPDAGRRPVDGLAAARLGRARSSVFPAPPRPVLAAADHRAAVELCRAYAGYGISVQAWNIVAKITEVDGWMTPERQRRVVEVHPELSFRRLDPRVVESKKTARGVGQRLRALAGQVDVGDLAEMPAGVPLDDGLDALAAAWSAARWRDGTAEVLGGERDGRGLRMEMIV